MSQILSRHAMPVRHLGSHLAHVQAVDSILTLVRAVAQQWFGVWLRPKAPSDEWLLQGLCTHFANLFIGKYLGRNEILYRCRPN